MKTKSRGIVEKGQRSYVVISYSLSLLTILVLLFPLLWAFSSSIKDPISLYTFPPKWIPPQPQSLTINLDYSATGVIDRSDAEKDGLKAMWYSWKKYQNLPIGQIEVRGIFNGSRVYEMKMKSYQFISGKAYIMPTEAYSLEMMNTKYKKIMDSTYTDIQWHGFEGSLPQETEITEVPENSSLSSQIVSYLNGKDFLIGKLQYVKQRGDWIRIFDTYLAVLLANSLTTSSYTLMSGMINSAFVTFVSIISQLLMGGTAAYALAKLLSRKWANRFSLFFVATIMIPEIAVLVPLYLVTKTLGLTNSLWGVILPHASWGIVIYMFRGFFEQLPDEVIQAARIDGAGEWRIFRSIVVRMSFPIFTIISIMTFIAVWNEFLWPLVLLRDETLYTLTLVLNAKASMSTVSPNTLMAMLLLSAIPLIIVFATCQKLIEKGVSWTGVKG